MKVHACITLSCVRYSETSELNEMAEDKMYIKMWGIRYMGEVRKWGKREKKRGGIEHERDRDSSSQSSLQLLSLILMGNISVRRSQFDADKQTMRFSHPTRRSPSKG